MKLLNILSERPQISLVGKKAYGDGKLLKDLTLKDVTDNIVYLEKIVQIVFSHKV